MDIKQIRYFVTAVRCGSITTAAHKLRVAQPALSRQIRLLEEDLGANLLLRTSKGVALTPAGQALFDHAEEILQRVTTARDAVRVASGSSKPTLRVAVPPTLSTRLGVDFLKRCSQSCPDVVFNISESWSGYISNLLDAGLADFGVMSIGQVQDFALRAPILAEDLYLVRRRREPDGDADDPIDAHDLGSIDLVLPTKLQGVRILLEDTARKLGIKLRVVAEADAWGAIRNLVETSDASAILSLREIQASMIPSHICSRPIVRPTIRNEFYLVAAARQKSTPKVIHVFECLTTSMRECLRD